MEPSNAISSNQFLMFWFQTIRYQSIFFQTRINESRKAVDSERHRALAWLLNRHFEVTTRSRRLLKRMFVVLTDPIGKGIHDFNSKSRVSVIPIAKMFDP